MGGAGGETINLSFFYEKTRSAWDSSWLKISWKNLCWDPPFSKQNCLAWWWGKKASLADNADLFHNSGLWCPISDIEVHSLNWVIERDCKADFKADCERDVLFFREYIDWFAWCLWGFTHTVGCFCFSAVGIMMPYSSCLCRRCCRRSCWVFCLLVGFA